MKSNDLPSNPASSDKLVRVLQEQKVLVSDSESDKNRLSIATGGIDNAQASLSDLSIAAGCLSDWSAVPLKSQKRKSLPKTPTKEV